MMVETARISLCLLIVIASLLALGCENAHPPPLVSDVSTRQSAPESGDSMGAIIPDDVTFEVINSSTVPGIKRSLDVRLNQKVSEDVLRAMALKLKGQEVGNHERTFIVYYLPGMDVDAGGWATTHFDPELEVRILGLTMEAEEGLASQPTQNDREFIGRWLDESPFVGSRIVLFRKDGKDWLEQTFQDGSSGTYEVVATQSSFGQRYAKREGSRFGDHWVVGPGGELQIRDNEGLIRTARRLE